MDEETQQLLAFIKALQAGGLAEDQQPLLQQQMAEALRYKQTEMPDLIESRGMNVAPSILAVGGAAMRQALGGQAEQRVREQQYKNLGIANQAYGETLKQKLAELLRGRQQQPAVQGGQGLGPTIRGDMNWPPSGMPWEK